MRLVPSARAEAGAALLTTWPQWLAYATAAPEIRLRGLRFAVAADERVLLLGTPLPPIPVQLESSDGRPRRAQRESGEWCRQNGVTPPEGSFESVQLVGAR